MPLKLSIASSRKIGEPNYGSRSTRLAWKWKWTRVSCTIHGSCTSAFEGCFVWRSSQSTWNWEVFTTGPPTA